MENYGLLSIIPTIVIIVLAWRTKQVMPSIIFGIFLGATFINQYNPFTGLLRTFDHYIVDSVADSWNISILFLNFAFGGMIAILAKSGGMSALGKSIASKAKNVTNTQLAVWFSGIVIYFDEIFNILIIGNTMKSVTDRFRISREKLAYFIDTTGSAIASLIPLSTWVAFEVGLVHDSFEAAGVEKNAFQALLGSIPYRFYSIFVVLIPLVIILTKREFGPMHKAELRARKTGKVLSDTAIAMSTQEIEMEEEEGGKKLSAPDAVILILFMIFATVAGLFFSGGGFGAGSVADAFGNADAAKALVWASVSGSLLAGAFVLAKGVMKFSKVMDTWVNGAKSILFANMIIVLAWALGSLTGDLGTADYIIGVTDGLLTAQLIPLLIFLIATVTSFATGTSWGTMAILMPIAIPLGLTLGSPMSPVIASVLTGSIFGDHCSPISDTTILSSMASGCDHIDHVKTQIPYALLGAVVAGLVGFLPAGFGVSSFVTIPAGIVLIIAVFLIIGKKVDDVYEPEKKDGPAARPVYSVLD
ncbi:MAG: Na+/H+ antiporter NhaC family protein [Spirochaetales bacterium]|nr:Na+/H+ antiporter NhaC family protein [Spirochaetales bacterium]